MANKITKRMVIEAMLGEAVVKSNEMYVNYLTHELELLNKKSANKKPTKTQEANKLVKAEILATLDAEEGMTISEILVKGNFAEGTSNQKISALVKQLVDAGEVIRTEGKKTLFTLA